MPRRLDALELHVEPALLRLGADAVAQDRVETHRHVDERRRDQSEDRRADDEADLDRPRQPRRGWLAPGLGLSGRVVLERQRILRNRGLGPRADRRRPPRITGRELLHRDGFVHVLVLV
jgi:hypothetical protein